MDISEVKIHIKYLPLFERYRFTLTIQKGEKIKRYQHGHIEYDTALDAARGAVASLAEFMILTFNRGGKNGAH